MSRSKGVSGTHAFPRVATSAALLVTVMVAAGFVWATSVPAGGATAEAPLFSIRMQFTDPAMPGGLSDWIDLDSYHWGMSHAISHSLPSGNLGVTAFTIEKEVDKASPNLMKACLRAQIIPKVEIQVLRAGGDKQTFLRYELRNALVSSLSFSGNSGGSPPTESVSFTFETIEVEYAAQGGGVQTLQCSDWQGFMEGYRADCTAASP